MTNEALGLVDVSLLFALVDDFATHDAGAAIKKVSREADEGRDFSEFGLQLTEHLRNLLLASTLGPDTDLLDVPADRREQYRRQAEKFAIGDLYRLIDYLRDFLGRLRWSTQPLMDAQMLAVRAAKMDRTVEFGTILGKLDDLLRQGTTPGPAAEFDLFSSTPPAQPAAQTQPIDTESTDREKTVAPRDTARPAEQGPQADRDTAEQPTAENSPLPTAGTQPVSDDLRERILQRIRRHSTIMAGFLTDARITRGEGGAVDVTVYHGNGYIQKQLAQKSNANMIQAEVAAEMGQRLHVRLHVHSGPPPEEKPKSRPAEIPVNSDELLKTDKKLRMIVEKFDAEILPDDR